jgi:hypothetical protein
MLRDGGVDLSQFEYLFTLLSLLLGFILVEVLSGLARTLRARLPSAPGVRAHVHIGWLTPMLGAYVMLDIAQWWGTLWAFHELIPLGFDTEIGGLLLCSFYYYAASMIFPDEPRAWPDVDEWFWLHRRQVLGPVLLVNLASQPFLFGYNPGQPVNLLIIVNGVLIGSLLVAFFARKTWIVTAALAVLIAENLSFIPIEILHRHGLM